MCVRVCERDGVCVGVCVYVGVCVCVTERTEVKEKNKKRELKTNEKYPLQNYILMKFNLTHRLVLTKNSLKITSL